MNLEFSWYVSSQLQDWIVSKKPFYPNLEECICGVNDKLKTEDSSYSLTKRILKILKWLMNFKKDM